MTICIMFIEDLLVGFINKKDDGFWLCCVGSGVFMFLCEVYVGCG
jgi:hypothetical protein